MQVQTQCQCGARYAFSEGEVGQNFRCSVCHQVFNVPPPGQKPIVITPQEHYPPTQSAPPPKPMPATRSGGGGTTCLVMGFCLILLLVAGGLMMSFLFASATRTMSSLSSFENSLEDSEQFVYLSQPKKLIKKYEREGFVHVEGYQWDRSEAIEEKTLFTDQVLDLNVDAREDLAIVSQAATLRGKLSGDVEFHGQKLTIEEGAIVEGDVQLGFAQIVAIRGKVKGKLTGQFQIIQGAENVEGGVESKSELYSGVELNLEKLKLEPSVETTIKK